MLSESANFLPAFVPDLNKEAAPRRCRRLRQRAPLGRQAPHEVAPVLRWERKGGIAHPSTCPRRYQPSIGRQKRIEHRPNRLTWVGSSASPARALNETATSPAQERRLLPVAPCCGWSLLLAVALPTPTIDRRRLVGGRRPAQRLRKHLFPHPLEGPPALFLDTGRVTGCPTATLSGTPTGRKLSTGDCTATGKVSGNRNEAKPGEPG